MLSGISKDSLLARALGESVMKHRNFTIFSVLEYNLRQCPLLVPSTCEICIVFLFKTSE